MTSHPWSAGFETLPDEHDYRVDEVDGSVPATLRGTLFRNGSGRNDLAGQWFAHWFDGDGMISKIRFDETGIHYRNRYVATANYRDESKTGRIVHRGFGKMRPYGVLGNAFRQPANVSNTSVVMQGERLLSLWEGGPPTALDPATLDTHGIEDFRGVLKAFSAHPKIDPDTGELFNFGIDYGAKTTLTPYKLDRGVLTRLPPVVLPYPVMNHDFVLTARYMVFCLGPILLHPLRFVLGFKSFDRALHWEGSKPTQILLVPRDGVGEARWIETDAFFQSTSPTASRKTAPSSSTSRATRTTARSARRCGPTGAPPGRRAAWPPSPGCASTSGPERSRSRLSPRARRTSSRPSIRPTSENAIATPISPAILPRAKGAYSSRSRGSTSRPARLPCTILARRAMSANRCSFRQVRAARRTTASCS